MAQNGDDEVQAVRLFCFPHAGGGISTYRHWVGALGIDIEVVPVALPGREARIAEPAHENMETLAEQITRELRPSFDRPYVFFGHSMGAALAWAVARRSAPLGVIASARRAPHMPSRQEPISELSDREFIARLRRLDGTPPEVLDDPELMELLVPILRADFRVTEQFLAPSDQRLGCPLVAMAGEEDPDVSGSDLREWAASTTGAFHTRHFPGGHFYLTENPDVLAAVGEEIRGFVGAVTRTTLRPQ